jgi:hypothetical protein
MNMLCKTIKINKISIAGVWGIRRGRHFEKTPEKSGYNNPVTGIQFFIFLKMLTPEKLFF